MARSLKRCVFGRVIDLLEVVNNGSINFLSFDYFYFAFDLFPFRGPKKMTWAFFLNKIYDLYVSFFGSNFFRLFGVGFIAFFALCCIFKIVRYLCVRFN